MTTNKYICSVCNKPQETENGIYSVMKTGKCMWHATGDKIKSVAHELITYPNFGLSFEEEEAVRKMYAKQLYGIEIK